MKTVLAIAAMSSLFASAAFADCAWHNKTSAEADVDRTIVTASVKTTPKQDRLPAATTDPLILEEEQEAPVSQ